MTEEEGLLAWFRGHCVADENRSMKVWSPLTEEGGGCGGQGQFQELVKLWNMSVFPEEIPSYGKVIPEAKS